MAKWRDVFNSHFMVLGSCQIIRCTAAVCKCGYVYRTYADTQDLFAATGYQPKIGIKEGVAEFVAWYRNYYQI